MVWIKLKNMPTSNAKITNFLDKIMNQPLAESRRSIRVFWFSLFMLYVLIVLVCLKVVLAMPLSSTGTLVIAVLFWITPLSLKRLSFRIWSKAHREISRIIKELVLKITYYVVFPVIGLAGTTMSIKKPPTETLWRDFAVSDGSALISKTSRNRWLVRYIRFCIKSHNLWLLSLCPFILLLKILENPTDATPSPASLLIYTLY